MRAERYVVSALHECTALLVLCKKKSILHGSVYCIDPNTLYIATK